MLIGLKDEDMIDEGLKRCIGEWASPEHIPGMARNAYITVNDSTYPNSDVCG